jgi:hypothetical protein
MLLGSPLRAATSRNGRASPDDRKADNSCDEWTTDFTRYGSRAGGLVLISGSLAKAVVEKGVPLSPSVSLRAMACLWLTRPLGCLYYLKALFSLFLGEYPVPVCATEA